MVLTVKNKLVIFTGVVTVAILVFTFLADIGQNILGEKTKGQSKHIIAACPSCYELALKLDQQSYSIIKTNSTADSIALLQAGKVDSIFAGRTLKPQEPKLEAHVIKEGLSFISKNEMSLSKAELSNYVIYTDLDINQLKSVLGVKDIVYVNDVYKYLDKGLVVTSWENTDYSKANLVHVMENDGQRLDLSRQPTLFCHPTCDLKLLSDISNL